MSDHYVYALVDPRDGQPFYIGKGQGNRAYKHTAEVKAGRARCNRGKIQRIESILIAGLEPAVDFVAHFETQAGAFAKEIELIASTPGLTNIGRGGEGWALARSWKPTRQDKRTKDWLTKWLAIADTWPDITFPNLENGVELARQFRETVRRLTIQRTAVA